MSQGRPTLLVYEIIEAARTLYGLQVCFAKDLGSFVDQNYLLEDENGDKFVFKIHDPSEPKAVLDLQNKAIQHLDAGGFKSQLPLPQLSIKGNEIEVLKHDGTEFLVRLLSYVDGELLKSIPSPSESLLREVGETVGHMDAVLAGFDHPASNRRNMVWDIRHARRIAKLTHHIEDPARRRLADFFFMKFEDEVADCLDDLPLQICHNDCHRYSLMVTQSSAGPNVSGVIDFGDTTLTHRICHLATVVSDMMVAEVDILAAAVAVVVGYHSVNPLLAAEIDLLHTLVATRLAMYGALSAKSQAEDPDNSHAALKSDEIWLLLRRYIEINPLKATDMFRQACGLEARRDERAARKADCISSRKQHFSSSLYTHYEEPLHLESGALQYLYDSDGKTYLDCVNNVCQWGHNHPSIVKAAQKQIAKLNTNSRYIYEGFTRYGECLTATMPERLDCVFFVNSGSEANDLAMRMARVFTGNSDMVVIDHAYHGNSSACTDISPHRIDQPGKVGLPGYVHKIPAPDGYRGVVRGDLADIGTPYAAFIESTLRNLSERGNGIAAFYAESLIGTGGQIVLPEGYLKHIYQKVRLAGGICIADEVQVGFGRTGEQMWCFESQGVVPDIVTMGKPIGNGHPMAAVVTRREIAEAFDNGITYFNTFGGNPVSCATGLAVLDVLEGEGLMANTVRMASMLRRGLADLMASYCCIGDVRGQGLYIGVEIVKNSESREPAPVLAKAIVEDMKQRGVLLNTNGYDNNVIKIKPPLVIDARDIDFLLNNLKASFAHLGEVSRV